jgi:hypothetical protein
VTVGERLDVGGEPEELGAGEATVRPSWVIVMVSIPLLEG